MSAPAPAQTEAAVDPADRPLSDRLVDATLELLSQHGIESISLRAIARHAGVSHGAPLRHFRSLADLLAEVAAHGFRLLHRSLALASEALEPGAGPVARLRAAGSAYVRTAVEHHSLFGLMFRPDTVDVTNERFLRDSEAAFDRLVVLVRAAQDSGWHRSRDTRLLAGVIWAQIHGLATLWASGAFQGPVGETDLDEALDLALALSFDSVPDTDENGAKSRTG